MVLLLFGRVRRDIGELPDSRPIVGSVQVNGSEIVEGEGLHSESRLTMMRLIG